MTPEQMMAAGWKVFDFTAGNYEPWRDLATSWMEQNWSDYPLELYGFSCDGVQGSLNIACYWAASPATIDVLQAHCVAAAQPPVVSIGETASQASVSAGGTTGDDQGEKPSGVNPLGGVQSPVDFGGFTLPKWVVYAIVYLAVRRYLKKQRKPAPSQKLKRFFYNLFAW